MAAPPLEEAWLVDPLAFNCPPKSIDSVATAREMVFDPSIVAAAPPGIIVCPWTMTCQSTLIVRVVPSMTIGDPGRIFWPL
jgi:hypothetical protein